MTWNIWLCSSYTGDRKELIATYYNRGHAVAALRGLLRRTIPSELVYRLMRG